MDPRKNPLRFVIAGMLISLWIDSASFADRPRMLFQGGMTKDLGAAGGARGALAIMRLPDGSFAFYDRHQPENGPLTLPDAEGRLHKLLPHLPAPILQSKRILTCGVLDNTQVILANDNEIKSVTVRSETLDKQTAARVGLPDI